MNKLLVGAAVAAFGVSTAANAASVTIGNLIITQISAENTLAFSNDAVGAQTGATSVCDWAYCGGITFAADGAVETGNTASSAAPAGDSAKYLYGINGTNADMTKGAMVVFDKATSSFNFEWGSIDALIAGRYDNVLTVNGHDVITASELVAAGITDGLGNRTDASDNQWFNVKYVGGTPINDFTASSPKASFEFAMAFVAVPEPSTWAMMGLGFAALGFAGLRRSSKVRVATA